MLLAMIKPAGEAFQAGSPACHGEVERSWGQSLPAPFLSLLRHLGRSRHPTTLILPKPRLVSGRACPLVKLCSMRNRAASEGCD